MKTKAWLSIAIFLIAISIANFGYCARTDNYIPVEDNWGPFSCSSVAKVYLNEDSDHDTIPDVYFYLNSNFILNSPTNNYSAGQILRTAGGTVYSEVKYYRPLANMIYKIDAVGTTWPLDDNTFRRASRVFPYNTPVRGIATTTNAIVFERPSDNDPNKNTVGFEYNYRYKYAVWFDGSSTSSYWYNQVPSMSYLGNTNVTYQTLLPGSYGNKKRLRSSWISSYNVCRDYHLHRCGDGTLDTYDSSWSNQFTWEVCDDGALNGTPWHCDASCGNGTAAYFCGDSIVNDGSSTTEYTSGGITYGPTYMSWGEEQIEQCDEWANNNDNYQVAWCSTYCENNLEPESFPEELGG